MNRRTPAALAIFTHGPNESKFTDWLSAGSSSTLGSLEMQARWITASQPCTACRTVPWSRTSPLITVSRGLDRTAASGSSP